MTAALSQPLNTVAAISQTEGGSWASQSHESLRSMQADDLTSFKSVKEFDIQTDYKPGRIPMENGLFLQLNDQTGDPLRLGFHYDEEAVEIIGWGLRVPSADRHELPSHLGRRFFKLYSQSITGTLCEQNEACFAHICRQVDYRTYLAARTLPRYREATLMRREPVLLVQFLDAVNVKLSKSLEASLRHLRDGERFGAWFSTDPDGRVVAITNPVELPALEDAAVEQTLPRKPIEFPEALKALPPNPTDADADAE